MTEETLTKETLMKEKNQYIRHEKYRLEAARLLEEAKLLEHQDSEGYKEKKADAFWYVERIVCESMKGCFYHSSIHNLRFCDKGDCVTVKWQDNDNPGCELERLLYYKNEMKRRD